MKIILDNIIFSLQKSGGISVLWGELINNFKSKGDKLQFLECQGAISNIVRRNLNLKNSDPIYSDNTPLLLTKLLPAKADCTEKFIFASSYYRYSNSPGAINITIIHDFTYEYYRKGIAKWLHTYQKRKAVQNSKGIICISENTKNDLLKFFPEANEKEIKVIYNGVSDGFRCLGGTRVWKDIREDLEDLEQKKCVLFVGSRARYKNFDIAAKAVALLDDNYHLVVVGNPLSASEEKRIKKLMPKANYTIMHNVSNETLNEIYNNCFVFIYPSSYEGFGIPILEAMRAGLPVIARNTSSIPEVAGNAALLLEKGTEMEIIEKIRDLNDESLYQKIKMAGFHQSGNFSWNKTMEGYYEFFKKIYNQN